MALAEAASARREAHARFMLAQIEILRFSLPGKWMIVTPEERARLLKLSEVVVQTYVKFYDHVRPHQGMENRPLTIKHAPIPIRKHELPPILEEIVAVQRQSWLSGLLNYYERKAA